MTNINRRFKQLLLIAVPVLLIIVYGCGQTKHNKTLAADALPRAGKIIDDKPIGKLDKPA